MFQGSNSFFLLALICLGFEHIEVFTIRSLLSQSVSNSCYVPPLPFDALSSPVIEELREAVKNTFFVILTVSLDFCKHLSCLSYSSPVFKTDIYYSQHGSVLSSIILVAFILTHDSSTCPS